MGFIGKQFKKAKKGLKEDFARRAEIKKVERDSLHTARLREAEKFGAKKAAVETKNRLTVKKGIDTRGFAALADGVLGPASKGKGKKKNISDFI